MTAAVLTYHPRFESHARAEVRRRVGEVVFRRLDTGAAVVESRSCLSPPGFVFVEHIAPVDFAVQAEGEFSDVAVLAKAVANSGSWRGYASVAAECRRGPDAVSGRHEDARYTTRDVEIAAGTLLEAEGAVIDRRLPAAVIHIYLTGREALVGIAAGAGQRRFADWLRHSPPTRVSRAEHKLEEAIEVFGLDTRAGAAALDLGAAPGGWAALLASRGLRVTAVDPAVLHPAVAAHPAVEHLRRRAETVPLDSRVFDLVVNDMAIDPDQSAEVMARVSAHVVPNAAAVMTLKLPTRNVGRWTTAARAALGPHWHVLAARHLAANRQELTWLLQRAPSTAPEKRFPPPSPLPVTRSSHDGAHPGR